MRDLMRDFYEILYIYPRTTITITIKNLILFVIK